MDIIQIVESVRSGESFSVYGGVKMDEATDKALSFMPYPIEILKEQLSKIHLFEINVDIDPFIDEVYGYAVLFDSNDKIYEFVCSFNEIEQYPHNFTTMLNAAHSTVYNILNDKFNKYTPTNPLAAMAKLKGEAVDVAEMIEEGIAVRSPQKSSESITQTQLNNNNTGSMPYAIREFLLHNADANNKQTCNSVNEIASYVMNTIIEIINKGVLYGCKVIYTTKDPLGAELIAVSMFESDFAFNGVLMIGECLYHGDYMSLKEPYMKYTNEDRYENDIREMVYNNIFKACSTLHKISSGSIRVNIIAVTNNKEECKYVC